MEWLVNVKHLLTIHFYEIEDISKENNKRVMLLTVIQLLLSCTQCTDQLGLNWSRILHNILLTPSCLSLFIYPSDL